MIFSNNDDKYHRCKKISRGVFSNQLGCCKTFELQQVAIKSGVRLPWHCHQKPSYSGPSEVHKLNDLVQALEAQGVIEEVDSEPLCAPIFGVPKKFEGDPSQLPIEKQMRMIDGVSRLPSHFPLRVEIVLAEHTPCR